MLVEEQTINISKRGSMKKTGFAAVLAIVLCMAAAGIYNRYINENNNLTGAEISDGTQDFQAQGYAGYKFVNHALTWEQAYYWCANRGMMLATMDEGWKRDKIRQLSGNRAIWVGYRARCNMVDRNCWRWTSGAPTGWAPWAPHEPNNLGGEYCAELMANGLLNNHQCQSHRLPFVCDQSPYKRGYAMHGVNGHGLTWDEADAQCRIRYHTGLATLNDPENTEDIMRYYQTPRAWVGLRVPPFVAWSEANFKWISGEPRRHPIKWWPNEPNGHHERCGDLHMNGRMNDLPCNARLKWFLCDQFVGNTLRSFSTFEINGERNPIRDRVLPAKWIFFNGRKRYRLLFKLRLNGLSGGWANIMQIGHNGGVRLPAVWLHPGNQNRLHIRQNSIGNMGQGCDPERGVTPGLRHWFDVQVYSQPNSLEVRYNNVVRCRVSATLIDVRNKEQVWLSSPWYHAAPVTVQQMTFTVY